MAELSTDVQYIKGIGPQRAKALQKVGVTTLEDLVSYFPRATRTAGRCAPSPSFSRARAPASGPWWPRRLPSAVSARGWSW